LEIVYTGTGSVQMVLWSPFDPENVLVAESDSIFYQNIQNQSRATASKKIVPTEEQPKSKP
jgi:hypothetical protein